MHCTGVQNINFSLDIALHKKLIEDESSKYSSIMKIERIRKIVKKCQNHKEKLQRDFWAQIFMLLMNHTLFFRQHYKITLDCTTPRSDQLRASLWHLIDILVNPSKGSRQHCSELERQTVCFPVCLCVCAHMMMARCWSYCCIIYYKALTDCILLVQRCGKEWPRLCKSMCTQQLQSLVSQW